MQIGLKSSTDEWPGTLYPYSSKTSMATEDAGAGCPWSRSVACLLAGAVDDGVLFDGRGWHVNRKIDEYAKLGSEADSDVNIVSER